MVAAVGMGNAAFGLGQQGIDPTGLQTFDAVPVHDDAHLLQLHRLLWVGALQIQDTPHVKGLHLMRVDDSHHSNHPIGCLNPPQPIMQVALVSVQRPPPQLPPPLLFQDGLLFHKIHLS